MSKRRRLSPEYKQEAVRREQKSDNPVSEIARDLRINYNILRKSVKQAAESGARAFPGHGSPRIWEDLR